MQRLIRVALLVAITFLVGRACADPATKVYHNVAFGYSVMYPADYFFSNDPVLMKTAMSAGVSSISNASDRQLIQRSDLGLQFVIMPPGETSGSNLVLIVQKLPPDAASMTLQSIAAATLLGGVRAVNGKALEQPAPVQIAGRTFYTYVIEMTMQATTLRQRQFVYYDSKSGNEYCLGVSGRADTFAQSSKKLVAVARTLHLDSRP